MDTDNYYGFEIKELATDNSRISRSADDYKMLPEK